MAMVMDCAMLANRQVLDASNIRAPADILCIFLIHVPLFFVSGFNGFSRQFPFPGSGVAVHAGLCERRQGYGPQRANGKRPFRQSLAGAAAGRSSDISESVHSVQKRPWQAPMPNRPLSRNSRAEQRRP